MWWSWAWLQGRAHWAKAKYPRRPVTMKTVWTPKIYCMLCLRAFSICKAVFIASGL